MSVLPYAVADCWCVMLLAGLLILSGVARMLVSKSAGLLLAMHKNIAGVPMPVWVVR